MTNRTLSAPRPRQRRGGRTAGLTAGLLALAGSLALAPAALAVPPVKTSAVVVKVVHRAPVGKMLATTAGASLYTDSSSCTSGCLTVWPPLVMPKGRTVPKGISGLATVSLTLPSGTVLQVTYDGKPLYTFSGDTGKSLNGNGLGGFSAATVG